MARKEKLTIESSPEDWVEALCFNAKAMLSNAGQKGGIYPDFNPFSPQEIKSFLGLYVLHGLTSTVLQGDLILGEAWRLDAFSAYPFAT